MAGRSPLERRGGVENRRSGKERRGNNWTTTAGLREDEDFWKFEKQYGRRRPNTDRRIGKIERRHGERRSGDRRGGGDRRGAPTPPNIAARTTRPEQVTELVVAGGERRPPVMPPGSVSRRGEPVKYVPPTPPQRVQEERDRNRELVEQTFEQSSLERMAPGFASFLRSSRKKIASWKLTKGIRAGWRQLMKPPDGGTSNA